MGQMYMRELRACRLLLLAVSLLPFSTIARADLYVAAKAYEDKELTRAFELYRELAELGHPEAQEVLAIMYVNGEGVARDNTLGYAWAKIVQEQGPRATAQNIIDQLEPHLSETIRARAGALLAQFGKEGLQKSLLPIEYPPGHQLPPSKCTMRIPVNPDDYFPREAIKSGISGTVLVNARVWGDGRAHVPLVEYGLPERIFDAAGRGVGRDSVYSPRVENGESKPCTIRFKVKFSVHGAPPPGAQFKDNIDAIRKTAEAGDPRSQALYAHALEGYSELNVEGDRSIRWFLKAAQAGVPAAQYKVGNALLRGYAVHEDETKALIWLDKAAGAGNADAQIELANYHLRDMSDAAAVARAAALLEPATAHRIEARFYLLGLLASSPHSAIRNPQRALDNADEWLAPFVDNPIAFEIRAAAQSALGDFAAAQKNQAKAVGLAKKLGWNTTPQRERLAAYEADKAWTGDLFAFY